MESQEFLPSKDTGSDLEAFCWGLCMQLTGPGRERTGRTFQGGFHGPGLQVAHIISTVFSWQELGPVGPPNCKGSWKM